MKDRVPVICKLNEGIFSSRAFFLHRKCERRKVCRPWPLRGYKNRQGNETLMWKYGTGVSYQINNYSSTCGGRLLQLALPNALLSFEMKSTSYEIKLC